MFFWVETGTLEENLPASAVALPTQKQNEERQAGW